jgi:tetratricopeptide (TPR) repeat protein
MSLLMDALRKAEEAKRAQSDGGAAGTDKFASAPSAVEAMGAELSLEPIHAPTQADQAPTAALPPRRPPAGERSQREAIQNVFAAKSPRDKSGDRIFFFALVGVSGITLLGIGAYLWWQLQPRSTLLAEGFRPPPVHAKPAPSLATLPSTEPDTPPRLNMAESIAAEKADWSQERSHASPGETQTAIPIRISHSRPRVNPLLEQGYAALQQGNLTQAQQAYERMLAGDPRSIDALYGLAAIAIHRQQAGLAEDYYLRILEADPRDPFAHSGLASLNGRAGSSAESRLKTLIAEQPNVASLHFALGNLYAQDQRWRDAQQAYFLAYKNDNDSPDIVFNLAVSLDQLHQDRLAAQYYGEALRAAAGRPAAFAREQAQTRLRELQGAAAP